MKRWSIKDLLIELRIPTIAFTVGALIGQAISNPKLWLFVAMLILHSISDIAKQIQTNEGMYNLRLGAKK